MKHLIKRLLSALWTITLMALVALMSSLATMIWAVDLPPDDYTLLNTRWLNWPVQEYYSRQNIELLIEGPTQETLKDYEQNQETYIASIQSKLIRLSR
jgi:hypothetical protein